MFKLVGVQGVLYAIQDTEDNAIDVLPITKVLKCLNLGLEIGGITRISSSEFDYTDTYFPKEDEDSSEEDEYYDADDEYDFEGEEIESEEEYYDLDDETDEYEEIESEDEYYDAYDDGFNDEDFGEVEEEVSTVNKLYSHLNDEQIKLLKRYYLWFSQRIFDEGKQQKRTLKVTSNPRKLQKQKELNAMRNQGGLWAYAGFIDMGYRGAEYCTLGHPLRYVHLAWDISVSDIETSFFGEEYNADIEEVINSSNCIKFGIDCISDFFEIDKEYTDKLKRAQREAIKDMDFMCQYYENGTEGEVISSFTVMDEIINHTAKIDAKGLLLNGKDYKPLVPKDLTSFYRQFRKLNMVVPKSLVQEVRDNLIGWGSHKFIGWQEPNWVVVDKIVNAIVGTKTKSFSLSNISYSGYKRTLMDYFIEFFQLKSCGYYEYNAETFKDEGGASKPVRKQLYAIHNSVKRKFWSDTEYTFDYVEKLLDLEVAMSGLTELLNKFSTPTLSHSYSDNRYHLDKDALDFQSNYMREYDEEYDTCIYDNIGELKSINRGISSICRIDYNHNHSLADFLSSLNNKIDSLISEVDRYNEFALSKVQKEIDDKNSELEKEELARLEKERKEEEERERAKQAEAEAKEKASKLSDEEIRQYCIDNADKVKDDKKLKFALTVLDTVKKTGKCSDKQMYYIGQIYEKLSGVHLKDKRQASKVNLDDRKDIEQAIDTVLEKPDLLSNTEGNEKVYAILSSIKKYRTISERQMKYAEIALEVTKKN